MKKSKILVVTSNYPRYKGDTFGWFVHELNKRLTKKYKILVLAPHTNESRLDNTIDGIKIRRFKYFYPVNLQKVAYKNGIPTNIKKSILARFQLLFFIASEIISTIKAVKKEKPLIIHSHWLIPQGLTGALCKKLLNTPHIATLHSSEVTILKKIPLGKNISRFVIKHTDIIASVSFHRAEELIKFAFPNNSGIKRKIRRVPMGINTNTFGQLKSKKSLLKKKHKLDSNIVILFVGRLVEVKGTKFLIEALQYVIPTAQNVRLLIVGSGPEEEKLKILARKLGVARHVDFVGFIDNNNIAEYYALADIVVIPSIIDPSGFQEGLPVVLLESLASGKPVIGTKIPGIIEAITNGKNGLLVDPMNSRQISEKIIELIYNPKLRKKLSINALKSSKHYSWESVADKYEQLVYNLEDFGMRDNIWR